MHRLRQYINLNYYATMLAYYYRPNHYQYRLIGPLVSIEIIQFSEIGNLSQKLHCKVKNGVALIGEAVPD